MFTDDIYYDINSSTLNRHRNVPEPNKRPSNQVPEIALAMQALDNVWHGSDSTITSHVLNPDMRPNKSGKNKGKRNQILLDVEPHIPD